MGFPDLYLFSDENQLETDENPFELVTAEHDSSDDEENKKSENSTSQEKPKTPEKTENSEKTEESAKSPKENLDVSMTENSKEKNSETKKW